MTAVEVRRKELEKRRKELMDELQQQNTPVVAKLGDASIASPFTCRAKSVAPVVDIIRQGRCTLAETQQMYRILALNSLVMAYTLSALYFEGVRMGDTQATASGILVAMCFLFISRGQPTKKLSKQRPLKNLFHPATVLSIVLQFVVHLVAIIAAVHLAKTALPPDTVPDDPDSPFRPTLVNSVVFLVSAAMQVSNFAVNHRGHPFMQGITENKGLLLCLTALSVGTWLSALEVSPRWNTYFELVKFPTPEFRRNIIGIMVADFAGAWLLDRFVCLVFRL
jgi:cation-transporting ATPase 13A1